MRNNEMASRQKELCKRFGAKWMSAPHYLKVGISRTIQDGLLPINGLRHPPAGDTTGWYIWAGEELCQDDDFFLPLHAEHLAQWCSQVLPYLGLPAGWRFQVAPGHEDVWFDPELLKVD